MIRPNIIQNRYLTEDEIELDGRVLSDSELINEFESRKDIFAIESTKVIKKSFLYSYIIGAFFLISISGIDLRGFSISTLLDQDVTNSQTPLTYSNISVTKKGDDISNVAINTPNDNRPRKVYYFLGDGTWVTNGSRTDKEMGKRDVTETIQRMLIPLRIAYHKHANRDFTHSGRIVVKWAVDEWGYVMDCRIVESSMGDNTFESVIVEQIEGWQFGKVAVPGDITEITYPFEFVKPGMDRYEVSAL